jgi:hypothetical protein
MATIVMKAQDVIDAATKVIADIMTERDRRNNATINKLMQQRMISWRGFCYRTREQAVAFLEQQEMLSTWSMSEYAWSTLREAKALLKLAYHGDPVTLNEKDIEVLF